MNTTQELINDEITSAFNACSCRYHCRWMIKRVAELEQQLAKYTGAEANEYGQTQQRMAELQQELADLKASSIVLQHMDSTGKTLEEYHNSVVEENQRLKEQLEVLQEKD